ncbi:hypothetical protein N0V90_008374 [Kalmusia sp. IMI 367209]|nr:hypothetical protein N0V90_008374 [Kalmusia sp. IMI 367209]
MWIGKRQERSISLNHPSSSSKKLEKLTLIITASSYEAPQDLVIMLLSTILTTLLPFAIAQTGSPNSTNNVGSTPAQRHYVTASQAQTILSASMGNASALSIPQNIAVVDPSGLLVAFIRQDNAYPGSIDISIKKARTAVLFNGMASAGLYESAQPGQSLYGIEQTNGGLVVFGGG